MFHCIYRAGKDLEDVAGLFANLFRLQGVLQNFLFSRKKGIKAGSQAQRCLGQVLEGCRDLQQSPRARGREHQLLAEPGGSWGLQGRAARAGPLVADPGPGFGVPTDISGFGSDASLAIK